MPELRRELTLYGLTMVAIGSCIGSGIFLTPAQIAAQLPSPWMILLIWTLGGFIAVTGALTFAELGAMFPRAGGVYVYLKEGYGELAGFLYGWAYLLVITSGSIAALTIAFATYLAFIFPMGQGAITIVALVTIGAVTIINIVRVKAGEIFSNIFTGLKLLGIACLVVVGLVWGNPGAMTAGAGGAAPADGLLAAFGLALIGVLWSYSGWQHATFLAGEAVDPRRTIPKAIIVGAAVVAAVYVLTNLAYMFLLPVPTIAASPSVAADAVSTVIPFGGTLIAIVIAISVLGTAGIYTLSAPRVYYAMADDGIFFRKLAEVHPTFRTPVNAILTQSGWAALLLLFWGTFEDVITYVVFMDWAFFALVAGSVFVFRRRDRGGESPAGKSAYRVPGYPFTPLIFMVVCGLFVLNTLIERPLHAWVGLVFMAMGVGVYFLFRRGRAAS